MIDTTELEELLIDASIKNLFDSIDDSSEEDYTHWDGLIIYTRKIDVGTVKELIEEWLKARRDEG